MFRISGFRKEPTLFSIVGLGDACGACLSSPMTPVATIQIQQEQQFPHLRVPTFDAAITFHQGIASYRQAHPTVPLPNLILSADGIIHQFAFSFQKSPLTEKNLFDRLADLTRPEFGADRVALLEKLYFNPSLQPSQPFALTFALYEFVDRYLYTADLLDLPARTVYVGSLGKRTETPRQECYSGEPDTIAMTNHITTPCHVTPPLKIRAGIKTDSFD